MKGRLFVLAPLIFFSTACTDPGETTAVGAAAGGALGAGVGALVGSQSGNAGGGLLVGGLAGAGAGALVGNALEAQDEAIREQDEALERQDRVVTAQRTEIEELRRMSNDNIIFKESPLARYPAPGMLARDAATGNSGAASYRQPNTAGPSYSATNSFQASERQLTDRTITPSQTSTYNKSTYSKDAYSTDGNSTGTQYGNQAASGQAYNSASVSPALMGTGTPAIRDVSPSSVTSRTVLPATGADNRFASTGMGSGEEEWRRVQRDSITLSRGKFGSASSPSTATSSNNGNLTGQRAAYDWDKSAADSKAQVNSAETALVPVVPAVPGAGTTANTASAVANRGFASNRAPGDSTSTSMLDTNSTNFVQDSFAQDSEAIDSEAIDSEAVDSEAVDLALAGSPMYKSYGTPTNAKFDTEECKQAGEEVRSAGSSKEASDKLYHYRRALRLCPDNPAYHTGLGEVYLSLNRPDDAEFEFREALKLDPMYRPAIDSLGTITQ